MLLAVLTCPCAIHVTVGGPPSFRLDEDDDDDDDGKEALESQFRASHSAVDCRVDRSQRRRSLCHRKAHARFRESQGGFHATWDNSFEYLGRRRMNRCHCHLVGNAARMS